MQKPSTTTVVRQEQAFSGPLPPADHFSAYDQVLPGAGERILKMAEEEQRFRHELQRLEAARQRAETDAATSFRADLLSGGLRAQARAQVFAGVILLGTCGIGAYAIKLDHAGAGVAAIVGALTTATISFLRREPPQQLPAGTPTKEIEQKKNGGR